MNTTPLPEKLETATQWKDAQALKSAVGEWSDRIKVQVKQIQLRPMKRKWASISTTGRLTLNTELLYQKNWANSSSFTNWCIYSFPTTVSFLSALCLLICLIGKKGRSDCRALWETAFKGLISLWF